MKAVNLLAELKRRNVIRMAGLYFVGAWLIVQVAGTVLPMFGTPEWLPRTIVATTVIPLTLLRLDPMFDPLRGDPRFQKLCEEKSK